jgi:hypothetical protein
MNPKIAVSAKSIVIQQYLKGKSRDDIARGCGLSAGIISTIISEWRAKLGQYVVEDLHELGINLKRSAMNPLQCARGFKIISMLETLGVDQDQFEEFISGISMHCRKIDGLEPGKIASYLADLLAFSKTVQFSQIQQYIDKKKKENGDLEQYKQNLEKEESNSKAPRDASLYNEKIINDEIEAFSKLKSRRT